MNIHDFLYTVAISTSVGFLFGYFTKSIFSYLRQLIKIKLQTPKYLKKTKL